MFSGYLQTSRGQAGNENCSAQTSKEQAVLGEVDYLLWKNGCAGNGKMVDITCMDFNKAFNSISYHIPKLIQKIRKFGLEKQTVVQDRNWGSRSIN